MVSRDNSAEQLPQFIPPISARFRWLLRLWEANFVALPTIALASWIWDSWYLFVACLMLGFSAIALGRFILAKALSGSFATLVEDTE